MRPPSFAGAALLVVLAGPAWAQLGGSLTLVSDYRFRGVSLGAGQPQAQVNLGYDSPRGWYAGAFATGVDFDSNRRGRDAQVMAYAGYAARLPSGWSWEAGATRSFFARYADYDYAEVFGGLAFGKLSARLYFSPDYFGRGSRTLYAEVNAAYPLREWLHVLGHAGVLHSRAGAPAASGRSRFDARIGIGITHGDWRIQVARVRVDTDGDAPAYDAGARPAAWIVQVGYFF